MGEMSQAVDAVVDKQVREAPSQLPRPTPAPERITEMSLPRLKIRTTQRAAANLQITLKRGSIGSSSVWLLRSSVWLLRSFSALSPLGAPVRTRRR